MLLEQELFEKFHIKPNEHEIVLMKYKCNLKSDAYLHIFAWVGIAFFTILYIGATLITHTDLFSILSALIVLCIGCFNFYYWVSREIKNIKYQGFYITNQRLIAFNGESFLLEDILINTGSRSRDLKTTDLNFYTKEKFIQSIWLLVPIWKEDELNSFLQTLYKISNNEKILLINSEKKGLNNGFDYYIYKKIPLLKR